MGPSTPTTALLQILYLQLTGIEKPKTLAGFYNLCWETDKDVTQIGDKYSTFTVIQDARRGLQISLVTRTQINRLTTRKRTKISTRKAANLVNIWFEEKFKEKRI